MKWSLTVVIALTFTVISDPLVFGQIVAQAESRASERKMENPETPSIQKGAQSEQVMVHPTEGYFAVFGGYVFGGKFDAEGTGVLNGVSFGNGSLASSAVVGAKAGGSLSR